VQGVAVDCHAVGGVDSWPPPPAVPDLHAQQVDRRRGAIEQALLGTCMHEHHRVCGAVRELERIVGAVDAPDVGAGMIEVDFAGRGVDLRVLEQQAVQVFKIGLEPR